MSILISNAPIPSDIPKLVPGLQVWLDANDSNTMSFSASNALSQWRDKSSNAYIFNTINGTPLLLSDYYKQGVFFNSATSTMMRTTTTVPFNSNVTTIFAAGNLTSSMNAISMMLSYGSSNDCSLRFGNAGQNANDFFYSNTIYYNSSNPANFPQGPTNYFVVDGVLGPVIGGATASSNLQISTDAGQYGNRFYHGYFNELIVYSNTLTSAQRLQVEAYLAWKWGVIPRFPTSYSYTNSNPSIPVPLTDYPYSGKFTTDNLSNAFSSRAGTYNWTPSNVSGLLVWYDSADTTTLSNSGLTSFSWASKGSFTPLVMNVPAGSNGPVVSNYNGFPGIYFNGTNTKLVAAQTLTSVGASATTWITCATNFATITSNSPNDAAAIIAYTVANSERSIRFDCNVNVTQYTINTGTLRGVTNNTNGVRGFIDQANYFKAYTNGVLDGSNGTAVTYNGGSAIPLQMGQWNIGTLLGFIHEVLIFNRELSIDEYQKSEGYLAWKYGYQKSLPSSHPYYWFPPN